MWYYNNFREVDNHVSSDGKSNQFRLRPLGQPMTIKFSYEDRDLLKRIFTTKDIKSYGKFSIFCKLKILRKSYP